MSVGEHSHDFSVLITVHLQLEKSGMSSKPPQSSGYNEKGNKTREQDGINQMLICDLGRRIQKGGKFSRKVGLSALT